MEWYARKQSELNYSRPYGHLMDLLAADLSISTMYPKNSWMQKDDHMVSWSVQVHNTEIS